MKKLRYERKVYRKGGADKRRRNREAHWANRKARVTAMRKRYPRIRERERQRQKDYYKKNRGWVLARSSERRKLMQKVAPHVLKEYKKRHFKRYPHKRAALSARYRAKVLRATPPWSDRAKIEEVYAMAELMTRLLGRKYTVDHHYPLRGKKVCGLHVHENLCVVSELENRTKGNKMPVS